MYRKWGLTFSHAPGLLILSLTRSLVMYLASFESETLPARRIHIRFLVQLIEPTY